MGGLNPFSKPKAPKLPPLPKEPKQAKPSEISDEERRRMRQQKGRRSTLAGVLGDDESRQTGGLATKKLLGGG